MRYWPVISSGVINNSQGSHTINFGDNHIFNQENKGGLLPLRKLIGFNLAITAFLFELYFLL